jgi:tetratricopeptide (TPR) repeat protein
LEKSLGVWHPDYGVLLHSLAGVLSSQGKYGEAESLFRQSLEVDEKSLGVWHPSLYPTLTNLASVLAEQSRAEEGEPVLQRALKIAVRAHGPSHPDVAQVLNMLAQLQAVLGRSEAPETARLALATVMATLGVEHPITQQVAPILQGIASGGGTDANSEIASFASQIRNGAIAALRGEIGRDALIGAIEETVAQVPEGEEDGSALADLALYLRAILALLRGEPVPKVPSAYSEHMAAIEAARG